MPVKADKLGDMLFAFVFYGWIGWVIDSGYRSLVDRKWVRGGFSFLPFAPSYGFGAVVLLAVAPAVLRLPVPVQWVVLGMIFGVYEYCCGRIAVLVMKRRLWDYSGGRFHVHGHTDLLHAAYWATLALITVHVVHPWVLETFF